MVTVEKKDNKIRDPFDLIKAIMRSHCPLPTIEQVAACLNKAEVFTVL